MGDSQLVMADLYDHQQEPRTSARRRTVTITGHPEPFVVRRRPSRTFDERVARRPDRVAGWACAMGLMLILLAILTAH